MTRQDDPFFSTFSVNNHALPGAWRALLPEDFQWLRLPAEQRADCADCHKVAVGDYLPACRCCGYFPEVPNFMLGLALKDPAAREAVLPLIAAGHALPEGLQPTPHQFRAEVAAYAEDRFGKSAELSCPFFDQRDPRCRIFPYRNSVCATFFCAHDHGAAGSNYWTVVQQLAGHLEKALAGWAMGQAGIASAGHIQRLDSLRDRIPDLSDPVTGGWSAEARALLWGDRLGEEAAFFEQCADLVMENRDRLYDIACAHSFEEAIAYEQAVKDWIPTRYQSDVPAISSRDSEPAPIDALWYRLDLATRNLWALPFGDGPIGLCKHTAIADNPRDDALSRLYGDKPHLLTRRPDTDHPETQRVFLTAPEARLLRLFETPQLFGEPLFDTAEVTALPDARGFVAQCLRRGILVPVER